MTHTWDAHETPVRAEVARQQNAELLRFDTDGDISNLVGRVILRRSKVIYAQGLDLVVNMGPFTDLIIKIVKHVRSNGYPQAVVLGFGYDEDVGKWVLRMGPGPSWAEDAEDFESLTVEPIMEEGADEIFEVDCDYVFKNYLPSNE